MGHKGICSHCKGLCVPQSQERGKQILLRNEGANSSQAKIHLTARIQLQLLRQYTQKISPEMEVLMHSSLSEGLERPKGRSSPRSTLTSWPGIPCTLPGRRWWCPWSSDPAPLPSVPGLQLGRRSCSVQFCTSWGPALRLWSKQTGKGVVVTPRKGPFWGIFQCFDGI